MKRRRQRPTSSRSTSRKPEGRGERVQKVLAGVGFASRREIDRLVQSGRVVIDGRPAVPGDRLTGEERVLVDGNRIRLSGKRPPGPGQAEILLYHKPAGEISLRRDPERRKTVFESLPRSAQGRWIEMGGLEINASGLLLFTTDGGLADRLMRSSSRLEQRFAVRIRGSLSASQAEGLTQDRRPRDELATIESITAMGGGRSNNWYEVCLRDGGKPDLRQLFDSVGVAVSRLIRVRLGPLDLGRLPRGHHRLLNPQERESLLAVIGDGDRAKA